MRFTAAFINSILSTGLKAVAVAVANAKFLRAYDQWAVTNEGTQAEGVAFAHMVHARQKLEEAMDLPS